MPTRLQCFEAKIGPARFWYLSAIHRVVWLPTITATAIVGAMRVTTRNCAAIASVLTSPVRGLAGSPLEHSDMVGYAARERYKDAALFLVGCICRPDL